MKRYPEYKESGVEWIKKIPSHWKVKRLKYIAKIVASYVDKHINPDEIQANLCNYTDVYYHEKIDSSIDFMKGSCNQNEYERSLIQNGDIIITKDSESADDIGVPAFIQEELTNVVCGYHLSIIRSLNEIDGQFLFRFIQSNQTGRYFEVNAVGITRFSLGKSIIENLSTPLPPFSEQIQIANFLDRKTDQIDELIHIKERQVELLQEQRTALINQVVTKGLDPSVEMKTSGVEWIGEIPAHWGIKRLKHMVQGGLTNGLFKKKDQFGSGVKLINVIDMYQYDFLVRFKELDRVEAEPHEVERYAVEPGDIFFVRSSLKLEGVAASACITDVPESTVFECHLVRLQPCPYQVLSKYLINYLNSTETRHRLITLANTVTMTTISQPKLASLEIILPPLSEQQTIVDYLDQRTRETNNLISTEGRKIELLKEYRQSLISEAVTGKIDVRNEA